MLLAQSFEILAREGAVLFVQSEDGSFLFFGFVRLFGSEEQLCIAPLALVLGDAFVGNDEDGLFLSVGVLRLITSRQLVRRHIRLRTTFNPITIGVHVGVIMLRCHIMLSERLIVDESFLLHLVER